MAVIVASEPLPSPVHGMIAVVPDSVRAAGLQIVREQLTYLEQLG